MRLGYCAVDVLYYALLSDDEGLAEEIEEFLSC